MALLDTVRVGNVEVRMYLLQNRGEDYVFIKYHWAGKPKLKLVRRKSAADEKRARAIAHEVASAIYNNRAAHISEIGTGTHVLKAAEDALSHLNISVDAAAREYAAARDQLKGHGTLSDAVDYFVRSRPGQTRVITVGDAVEEYLSQMEHDVKVGSLSQRHLQDSRSRLRRFAEQFRCPLADVTAAEIQNWLRSLDIAPRTRNNFVERIAAFSHWAQDQNYLRRDITTEADSLKRVKTRTNIHIFRIEDFRKMLYGAVEHDPRCLTYLTVGTFAFIRPNEMLRMTGRNVRFQHNDIEVEDAQAKQTRKKSGHRRLVPMQPNLRAWLEAYPPDAEKPLVMQKTPVFVRELAKKLKITWHHDIMRHSGISYAVALTGNVDQVALWAGNSRQIIYESYLSQVTAAEAAEFFGMMPPQAGRKIISMA